MSAHTPGPWETMADPTDDHTICIVSMARLVPVARVGTAKGKEEETALNAARIVACVNGWDALVAERDALRAALERLYLQLGTAGGNTIDSPFRPYWEQARAALAQWEAK